jgi:hypothetical protein
MREISTSIQIRAPADRVWSLLIDFASYPSWNPFIREIQGDPLTGHRLKVRMGEEGGSEMTFRPRVLVSQPGQELRWLGRLGIPGLFDGEHRFVIAPSEGGVTFTQSETFRGLLVPLLWKRLDRGTRPMFSRMNEVLRTRAEQSDSPG